MKRKIFAVVLGVIAAVVIIIAIEALGHSLFPLPAGMDVTDTDAMKAYIVTLPTAALLIVMAAWIIATLGGGLLACIIARESPLIYSPIMIAIPSNAQSSRPTTFRMKVSSRQIA